MNKLFRINVRIYFFKVSEINTILQLFIQNVCNAWTCIVANLLFSSFLPYFKASHIFSFQIYRFLWQLPPFFSFSSHPIIIITEYVYIYRRKIISITYKRENLQFSTYIASKAKRKVDIFCFKWEHEIDWTCFACLLEKRKVIEHI